MSDSQHLALERIWQSTKRSPEYGVPSTKADFVAVPDPTLEDEFSKHVPAFKNIITYNHGEFSGFHSAHYTVAEVLDIIQDPKKRVGVAFSPSAARAIALLCINRQAERQAERQQKEDLF